RDSWNRHSDGHRPQPAGAVSRASCAEAVRERLDGRRFVLRAFRIPDHGNTARYERIAWVFHELLRETVSADLAALLLRRLLHVCGGPASPPRGRPADLCALVTVVGLPAVPSDVLRPIAGGCHRTTGCSLVARRRGAVLFGVALDRSIFLEHPS